MVQLDFPIISYTEHIILPNFPISILHLVQLEEHDQWSNSHLMNNTCEMTKHHVNMQKLQMVEV